MDPQNREPLIEETEAIITDTDQPEAHAEPVPVYAERAETKLPEASEEELKALALAYAKYLSQQGLEPGDPTFTDSLPEDIEEPIEA